MFINPVQREDLFELALGGGQHGQARGPAGLGTAGVGHPAQEEAPALKASRGSEAKAEFSVGDRKLHLSPVMDLFDWQILSYSIRSSPNLELTNTSLRHALTTLENGQRPLVHSDQGLQYQHASWRRLLQNAGANQSMSRKGNCYDNAVMENFFGHLKEELFHRVRFISTDALTTALHESIHWYNTTRISTKLEGLSPVQYRAQTPAA